MEAEKKAEQQKNLFDLIIVDDEPAILKGLESTYDWESFGFSVVGTAQNGEEALVLVKERNPDVVMTDIHMRKMDGLELIGHCLNYNKNLAFVVVSAYDNFNYAQKACELGVFSYLLKPVEDEQIALVMTDLYRHCETLKNQKQKIDQYQHFFSEKRLELEQILLKKILTGVIEISDFHQQLNVIGSKMSDSDQYCVIGIDLNIPTRILEDMELDVQHLILAQSFIEYLSRGFNLWNFELSDGRLIIILSAPGQSGNKDITLQGLLRNIILRSDSKMISNLVIARGNFKKGFSGLIESYGSAITGFESQTSIRMESGNQGGDIFFAPVKTDAYPRDKALSIIRGFRFNDYDVVHADLIAFGEAINTTDHNYRCLCFQRLCTGISIYLITVAGIPEKQIEKLARYIHYITKLKNDEFIPVLNKIFEEMISFRQKYILSKTDSLYNSRIKDALLFIDLNLGEENLSIGDTANHIALNEVYLGRLFKKVIGISFNEYLARRRVEKASGLLLSTDLTGVEISEKVGISSASYFSVIFKKYTGMSPSGYRKLE